MNSVVINFAVSGSMKKYTAAAAFVGMANGGPWVLPLVLQSRGIRIYPIDQVLTWLDQAEKKQPNARWCWKPLRRSDCNTYCQDPPRNNRALLANCSGSDRYSSIIYAEPLPLEPLLIAQSIIAGFQEVADALVPDVFFYVASFASDPFLAVCYREQIEIVAHWDEPGFGV